MVVVDGRELEEPVDGARIVVDRSPGLRPTNPPSTPAAIRGERELVVLALDKSGFMTGPRFEAVRSAATRVAAELSADDQGNLGS